MRGDSFRRFSRLLFRTLSYSSPKISVPHPGLLLTGVTVVNPGRERQPDQCLSIERDSISRRWTARPEGQANPSAAQYTGCYVLPGLVDMHVHLPPILRDLAGLLFLYYGVTAIRETGDADGSTWQQRRRIQEGQAPGPRILACGAVLDGDPPFLPTSWAIRDAREAEEAVAAVTAQGACCVKVHHQLSAPAVAGIREAAARHGLRVAGHVPCSVPFEECGLWDVQHLDGVVPYPGPDETPPDVQRKWRDLPDERIEAYVRASLAQRMVHTPTLVTWESLAWLALGGPPDRQPLEWIPRYYQAVWQQQAQLPTFAYFAGDPTLFLQGLAKGQQVVRALREAGVRIHLGTDSAGMPFLVPGAALQEELRLMAGAGLSLEDAWTAGTRAAGESLGVPLLGTVQAGAPADLLIFRQDPTACLDALSTLEAVVAQGRLYPRSYLQKALAQHRLRFQRPWREKVTEAVLMAGMRAMTRSRAMNR